MSCRQSRILKSRKNILRRRSTTIPAIARSFLVPIWTRYVPPSDCLALPSRDIYSLPGLQVEPEASFWTIGDCPVPCVIKISRLTAITDDPANPCYFPPYPTAPDVVRDEIEELVELASLRDDPEALFSAKPCRERREISPFLQYRPQPLSAVYNLDRDPAAYALRRGGTPEPNLLEIHRGEQLDAAYPVIRTGRELARWFETETPGLGHRHALNLLLRDANWSPPRQAWVWAALDVTIYSAHPGGLVLQVDGRERRPGVPAEPAWSAAERVLSPAAVRGQLARRRALQP